jgi:aldehyde dehydrogenase (NAD+)
VSTLSPLVAAISAGNAAVIRPLEVSAATAEVIAWLVPQYLDRKAFSVVLDAVPKTTALLAQQWDHIFVCRGRRYCAFPPVLRRYTLR